MRVVAIVQARMGSTRLPGKVLKKFGAHPVLWHVVTRVRMAVPAVVLAVPDTKENDYLISWPDRITPIYRGSEHDVLARFWGAALAHEADYVVRVTADCPLIDPGVIRAVVGATIAVQSYQRTPLSLARGLDVEAFPMSLLAEAFTFASDAHDREHVCPWMARRAKPLQLENKKRMRWTLDTEEDYAWFCRLAQHVNTEPPHPTTQEVLDYIAKTGDVLYEPEA